MMESLMEGVKGVKAVDPFREDLWRLSRFTLQSLQPLEALPWNEELPGEYSIGSGKDGHH